MDVDTHPVQVDAKKIEEVMCGAHAVTIDLSKGNLMKKVVIMEASDDIEVWKAPAKHFSVFQRRKSVAPRQCLIIYYFHRGATVLTRGATVSAGVSPKPLTRPPRPSAL